ncbi:hypothetical protein [Motiliproteus sp.]|uniref:hypothetical protein n=1 Tax=Motiliproteus sp. TaxID=1898955 RepID=UPI003BA8AA68
MYFLVTTHKYPQFYVDNLDGPIEVETIGYVFRKEEKEPRGKGVVETSFPMIRDEMQAISELYNHGVTGFKTKKDAKKKAAELGLSTWKYLELG